MDFNDQGLSKKTKALPKLNAKQLRDLEDLTEYAKLPKALEALDESMPLEKRERAPLYFILDNVYDTYNIGGLFRLADALNITKLYICGDSETPPNHKIKKASIGTYKIVPWAYKRTTLEAIEELKKEAVQVVAVEQDKASVPYMSFLYSSPLGLVVGNETRGCSRETIRACDAVVEIPMHGINVSLNVIVSTAIVGYHVVALDKPR